MRGKFLLLAAGWLVFQAAAQVQTVGTFGSVDWARRVVLVTGMGAPPEGGPLGAKRPNALRAAQMDALRKALETVKGMNLDASTTLANTLLNDVIQSRVSGKIRNFKPVGEPRYFEDMSVEADYEVGIDGDMAEAVMPASVGAASTAKMFTGEKTATGLIVDCKTLGLVPAMLPRILNEGGKEIFGSQNVSRSTAVAQGMVAYVQTLDQARALVDRIGAKPLVIKALQAAGTNKTNIVISRQNSDALQKLPESPNFFYECRVVLVVD